MTKICLKNVAAAIFTDFYRSYLIQHTYTHICSCGVYISDIKWKIKTWINCLMFGIFPLRWTVSQSLTLYDFFSILCFIVRYLYIYMKLIKFCINNHYILRHVFFGSIYCYWNIHQISCFTHRFYSQAHLFRCHVCVCIVLLLLLLLLQLRLIFHVYNDHVSVAETINARTFVYGSCSPAKFNILCQRQIYL